MESLKKLWPLPFKVEKGDVSSFVINLIIFIVICAVGGLVIGVLGALLPILGIVWWIIGSLLDLYGLVGIILCIVRFVTDELK